MKRLLLTAVCLMFTASMTAMAADEENSGSTTVDKSHNPITGSDTTTKTTKHKVKDASGAKHKVKEKKSTTHKSDGGTETKSSTEESNTPGE